VTAVEHTGPATVGQRLLWLLDHYRGGGRINCPLICRVHGPLETDRLQAALDTLVRRHEALRTTFRGRAARLEQLVHAPAPLPLRRIDLTGRHPDAVVEALRAELATPLDPAEAAVRATLWRAGPDEHLLCLTLHHLVADSWSCGVLFRELGTLLEHEGPGDPLEPVGWQYRDFATAQRELLAGDGLDRHLAYWRRQLDGMRLPEVPPPPPPTPAAATAVVEALVPHDVVLALEALGRAHQTTMFAVLFALYVARLHQLTGRRDVAVATLLANRSRPQVRNTIGFLANMVVLRVRLPLHPSFVDVLRKTRSTVADAVRFQELPYQVLPITVERGRSNVEDVVFQMMPEPIQQRSDRGAVRLEGVVPDVASRFDLELAAVPGDEGIRALLFHRTDRFTGGWARDLVDGYAALAAAAAAAPHAPLPRAVSSADEVVR